MKKLKPLLVIATIALFFSCQKEEFDEIQTTENINGKEKQYLCDQKQIVTKFYKKLYSNYQYGLDYLVSSDYKEHQILSNFSYENLKEYAANRARIHRNHKVTIHRIIEQGDYVFLHVEETSDTYRIARGELFRLENNKIVEHWGNLQSHPDTTPSGNSMFDGAKVNYNTNVGRNFRELFKQSDQDIFNDLDKLLVEQTRHTTYEQHNPFIDNGREQLLNWFDYIKEDGASFNVRNKITLAEGDFIVLLNHFIINPGKTQPEGNNIVFDLLRIREDGKTDAHWDITEPLNNADEDLVF